jgi:hypothetical protein
LFLDGKRKVVISVSAVIIEITFTKAHLKIAYLILEYM